MKKELSYILCIMIILEILLLLLSSLLLHNEHQYSASDCLVLQLETISIMKRGTLLHFLYYDHYREDFLAK